MAQLQQNPPIPGFKLSPSLDHLLASFGEDKPVSASDLVNRLLADHPHYGGGRAQGLQVWGDSALKPKPAREWLIDVSKQYDADKAPELHGHLMILGLSRLDRVMNEALSKEGFLEVLKAELTPPLESLLSDRGRDLWRPTQPAERVGLQYDHIASTDVLGRDPFAKALAFHLRSLHPLTSKSRPAGSSAQSQPSGSSDLIGSDQAFLLHLYGPWGSGKTSLFRLLMDKLTEATLDGGRTGPGTEPWIVVYFNAWQHQRIEPSWWALLDAVFDQAVGQTWGLRQRRRAAGLWLSEQLWRLSTAGTPFVLAILLATLILVLLLLVAGRGAGGLEEQAKGMSELLALAATVAGIGFAVTRSLLPGTAQAAQSFTDAMRNPMPRLANHFRDLIECIGWPVAVFIDDLDRCEVNYVIRFLENVQTLFRSAPVIYLIAADRSWLRASYEEAYKAFSSHVGNAASPLGDLFLEKIFQLSIPVPAISQRCRDTYWQDLLKVQGTEPAGDDPTLKQLREQAENELQNASTNQEIAAKINAQEKGSLAEAAYRAAALQQMVRPQVQKATEHWLQKYRHLVGGNPRAMKRMVNAYVIHQLLVILTGIDVPADTLPLWIILSMRWPRLAEHLCGHPALVATLSGDTRVAPPEEVPPDLRELWQDQEVRDVVKAVGLPEAAALNAETIQKCARLSS